MQMLRKLEAVAILFQHLMFHSENNFIPHFGFSSSLQRVSHRISPLDISFHNFTWLDDSIPVTQYSF